MPLQFPSPGPPQEGQNQGTVTQGGIACSREFQSLTVRRSLAALETILSKIAPEIISDIRAQSPGNARFRAVDNSSQSYCIPVTGADPNWHTGRCSARSQSADDCRNDKVPTPRMGIEALGGANKKGSRKGAFVNPYVRVRIRPGGPSRGRSAG